MKQRKNTKRNFKKIKLLVLDFDGVLTDNSVYVNARGKEMVRCSRADGLGIEFVRKNGIKIFVLSREKNKVVSERCRKLKIVCIQGVVDKAKILRRKIKKLSISYSQVCYIGNDINDMKCVELAGIGCAVQDGHPKLQAVADYVTRNKGGEGAVREICDLILES